MIKIVLIFIFISLTCMTNAQNQSFQWARQVGTSYDNEGNSITANAKGNSFVTGSLNGLLGFFVSEFDASGGLKWNLNFYGGYCSGRSITLDVSGNIYVTGYFSGKVDFDPDSTKKFQLSTFGEGDIFILKLSNNGELLWVRQIGGVKDDMGNSITIDPSGNVYTTGTFMDSVDFDPGAGIYNLTAKRNSAIFISKLDASGNFKWAASIDGGGYDGGFAIATDKAGYVYTTGLFTDTADFDPGQSKFEMIADDDNTFILKLNKDGGFVWAKGIIADDYNKGSAMVIDPLNNILIAGSFRGQVDFDPNGGITTLYSMNSTYDIFYLKLDNYGNLLWAQSVGGEGDDYGNAVSTDKQSNVYVSGRFEKKVDFDPSGFGSWLTSKGSSDVFILKTDKSGFVNWARQIGGNKYAIGNGLIIDPFNNIYLTGTFSGTADFNPESSLFEITADGEHNAFVVMLGSPVSKINEISSNEIFNIYPNPTQGLLNISLLSPTVETTIELYNSKGFKMQSQIVKNNSIIFNLTENEKGLYLVVLRDINGNSSVKKIILQ